MVFNYEDRFACENFCYEDGTCQFSYPKCFIDDAISPDVTGNDFGKLLLGPTKLFCAEHGEEMEIELVNFGEGGGWGLNSK